MKYIGSKNRIAKYILPIVLKDRRKNQFYVEPFCGGCNQIDKVDGNRIANDINYYLIEMWKALIDGWNPPYISRNNYYKVKNNRDKFKSYLVGWIGFNCSYCGKFFKGYAGRCKTKEGIRDYQEEALKNVKKQLLNLKGVKFYNMNYFELNLNDCIIYCDPPYRNTKFYDMIYFDYDYFYDWCRKMSVKNKIFISEYSMPDDFKCIWEMELNSSLSANGKIGTNKKSVERLFVLTNNS